MQNIVRHNYTDEHLQSSSNYICAMNRTEETRPSFNEALRFWTKLGFISFGGPAGQIAVMHEFLVEKKRWISDRKFLHALNYCMLLPGPEAQQLCVYTGWLLHGVPGGVAAGLLFILPSLFILAGLSVLYVLSGNNPWIMAMFDGLKPAVIAIVVLALIKIGKKALGSPLHYVLAMAAFIGIFFFNVPFPLLILGAIILAFLLQHFYPAVLQTKAASKKADTADEDSYYINANTIAKGSGYNPKRFWLLVVIMAVIWVCPMILFYLFSSDFAFWSKLSLFFTQAAFVTFGGAYAVLPYVAQVSVEQYGWLTRLQMMDGLALGETTPGPLIMVLAFVGFMAGYHHFDLSVGTALIALVITTFYTFLPSFLFILAGAPVIERTQDNPKIKQVLSLVSAAVVGVVLNLTIYLAVSVLFKTGRVELTQIHYGWLGWAIVSLVALHKFKINMIAWIGVSALFGIAWYYFTSIA